jgi:hypothetical protein
MVDLEAEEFLVEQIQKYLVQVLETNLLFLLHKVFLAHVIQVFHLTLKELQHRLMAVVQVVTQLT